MGIVTQREADLAADISSRVVGVKKVVKVFEVLSEEEIKQIDAILDKISTSGYDSLSDTEKEFLFRAGKDS